MALEFKETAVKGGYFYENMTMMEIVKIPVNERLLFTEKELPMAFYGGYRETRVGKCWNITR